MPSHLFLPAPRLPASRPHSRWPPPEWVATARDSRMAYRLVGLADGEPWLVLHGGPGGSSQPDTLHAFRLARQQVILPDQRGAGLSRPRGRTAGNHTDQLVADLEVLRESLGLERWSVLAGSWGTVLALRYAQIHPQRVNRLVLRGAFGLSRMEIRGLLHPDVRREWRVVRSPHWPRAGLSSFPNVLARLEQVLQVGTPSVAGLRLIRCWNLLEQGAALRGMRRSLLEAATLKDAPLAVAVRRGWTQLQRGRRRAQAGLNRPGVFQADRRGWQKFRIQAHYLRHKGFLRPGELDRAVRSLADNAIPSDWVHGRFDAICPPGNSRQWVRQTEGLTPLMPLAPGLACGHWPVAGHLASEPGIRAALAGIVQNRRGAA